MCIGRCVMADIVKPLPSSMSLSNGGYQNGIGSKYFSIRARCVSGALIGPWPRAARRNFCNGSR